MAASENCLFDPGQSIDNSSVYKIAKKCACGAIAKSGVQCVQCNCIYHKNCVNRIKYCCEVLLVAPNLEIRESAAESVKPKIAIHRKKLHTLKKLFRSLDFLINYCKVNALVIENCYLRDKLFIPNSNQLSVSKTSQIVTERHNVSNQHGKEAVNYPSTKHLQKQQHSNTNRTRNVQDEPHINASNVIKSNPNAESWTEVVKRKPELTNIKQGNNYIKKPFVEPQIGVTIILVSFLYVCGSNAEEISKYLVNKFCNQESIVEKLASKIQ
ncbi:hypothetical protein FQR65_LT03339 [Abscondita terminalis]|nr:hypothetical protein FQR65_LT03339 [Abscondita terminalis]